MNLPSFTTDFNEKYLNVFVDRALIAYASREMTQTRFVSLLKQNFVILVYFR